MACVMPLRIKNPLETDRNTCYFALRLDLMADLLPIPEDAPNSDVKDRARWDFFTRHLTPNNIYMAVGIRGEAQKDPNACIDRILKLKTDDDVVMTEPWKRRMGEVDQ